LRGKSTPNIWVSITFQKAAHSKQLPIGENLPNLVTLEEADASRQRRWHRGGATSAGKCPFSCEIGIRNLSNVAGVNAMDTICR
jgi:hypothetical protein